MTPMEQFIKTYKPQTSQNRNPTYPRVIDNALKTKVHPLTHHFDKILTSTLKKHFTANSYIRRSHSEQVGMNHVKQECVDTSSPYGDGVTTQMIYPCPYPAPQPMEGLNEIGPPPFLTKTYDMIDDTSTNQIVSWCRNGHSFVVWDPHAFATHLLPKHFKHNNFSSFVRQLNTYGFRKIDPDKWEFANEGFIRGQKQQLKNIRRRKNPSQPYSPQGPQQGVDPCVEVGRFGVDGEVDRLRRDKQVLMMELVKLRQQQQNTRAYLQSMEQRLQATEMKQQQMMNFLARAMQNPAFVQQLVQQKEKRKALEEVLGKKRRRSIEQGSTSHFAIGESSGHGRGHIKAEPLFGYDFGGVSELEALAREMQGHGRIDCDLGEEQCNGFDQCDGKDEELDDGFWDDLLNERFVGGSGEQGVDGQEDHMNGPADQLRYLG